MITPFSAAVDGDSSSAAENANLCIEHDEYDLSDDSDNPGLLSVLILIIQDLHGGPRMLMISAPCTMYSELMRLSNAHKMTIEVRATAEFELIFGMFPWAGPGELLQAEADLFLALGMDMAWIQRHENRI